MKRCLMMGNYCHWLPVRKLVGKTGLQTKENKDASSWEDSPGLTQLSGANTGGNSHESHLMQDHHTTEAISYSQKTPFSLFSSPQRPGIFLTQVCGAHICSYVTYGLTSAALVLVLFLQLHGNNPP